MRLTRICKVREDWDFGKTKKTCPEDIGKKSTEIFVSKNKGVESSKKMWNAVKRLVK